jgi:hypothetical protein
MAQLSKMVHGDLAYNHELYKLYNEPDIVRVIKSRADEVAGTIF